MLRALPSHGRTAGWVGRRDRALLGLSHLPELPYRHIADLTGADVTITHGTATITTPTHTTALAGGANDLLCGPCGARQGGCTPWTWPPSTRAPGSSPRGHRAAVPLPCQSNTAITGIIRRVLLFPPITCGDTDTAATTSATSRTGRDWNAASTTCCGPSTQPRPWRFLPDQVRRGT